MRSSKLTELIYTMKNLNYQLKQLCKQNRDGSYSTQANRAWQLSLIANQLHELGFRQMGARSLRPKHIEALTQRWSREGLSIGTQKNRLSVLRWWARKVGKVSVIARSNDTYGIGKRQYVAKTSKAQAIDQDKLNQITDQYVRLSVRLQTEFGLRREEAIKFQPAYEIQSDRIRLKSSWTKGGRAREIPITTDEQRRLLEEVRAFAGKGSMIPPHLRYVEQLRRYERQLRNVGLNKLHGLRHAYAQRRYQSLTGWTAPAAGGPASKSLSEHDRALDKQARERISQELGHSRETISAVYLGR